MIGSLHGVIELFDGSMMLVNVHGVGYRVHVPLGVRKNFQLTQNIDLYIYSHIREDIFDLYGFSTLEELKLFEALLSVSGIGPKTALGVFSIGTRDTILSAIQKADVSFFSSVPRLGKKNAQKLIIELKSKVGSLEELDLTGKHAIGNSDVVTALKSFGFTQREAEAALEAIGNESMDTSAKLKLALKYLGK